MRTLLLAALTLLVHAACSQTPELPPPDAGPSGCDPALGNCATPEALTSLQIDKVRKSVDAELDLPIDGAWVTYVVPRDSSHPDAHGFFVQAEKTGPALFVRVDPTKLSPEPEPGDQVRFRVRKLLRDPETRTEITEITNYERLAQGADLTSLVQDLSQEENLLQTGWQFDGELVRVEGHFTHEWIEPPAYIPLERALWFAAIEARGGYSNSRFVVVAPPALPAWLGDTSFCEFTLQAPFRTGTNSAELWAFRKEDFARITCSGVELVQALATAPDALQLTFNRPLDPATVPANGSSFSLSGGLAVGAASVDGRVVTLSTGPQQVRMEYDVEIDSGVKDVLGSGVAVESGRNRFLGFFPRAALLLNELYCKSARDLIELRVVTAGSTSGLALTWDGVQRPSLLATLPDAQVEVGDLVVVHLGTDPGKGDAIYPETGSTDEITAATNYPGAWDFPYEDTDCGAEEGILRVRDLAGRTMDGIALWNSGVGTLHPDFASAWLRGLQLEGHWEPRSCDGQVCSPTTTPSLAEITVDQRATGLSTGTLATLRRKAGPDTNGRDDWDVGPSSLGAPNP